MPATTPAEAKNFRLLGHDASAAWGGGSLVQVHKGHAYVGAVGGSSYNGPEGFTVHDVRDPTSAEKGRRIPRAARHPLPQAAHRRRRSALREFGAARRRQGQERARRLFHLRRLDAGGAEADRLLRHAGLRPAPLRRRSQARARLHAQRRAGLEQARDLDARHPRPAQARGDQHLGPAVDEDRFRRSRQRSDAGRGSGHLARPADDPRQPHVLRLVGRRHVDHRLHRSARHEARRPHQMVAAVSGLDSHLLAARRPALSHRHRRGARQKRNSGTRNSCG